MFIGVKIQETRPTAAGITILEISGVLDRKSFEEFKQKTFSFAKDDRAKMILDFHLVSFCDSAGMVALIELNNLTKELGGFLRLVAPSENVADNINLLGLNRVLAVYKDINEALSV